MFNNRNQIRNLISVPIVNRVQNRNNSGFYLWIWIYFQLSMWGGHFWNFLELKRAKLEKGLKILIPLDLSQVSKTSLPLNSLLFGRNLGDSRCHLQAQFFWPAKVDNLKGGIRARQGGFLGRSPGLGLSRWWRWWMRIQSSQRARRCSSMQGTWTRNSILDWWFGFGF